MATPIRITFKAGKVYVKYIDTGDIDYNNLNEQEKEEVRVLIGNYLNKIKEG